MRDLNRDGFSFESKNEKLLLNIGTHQDSTELTEWDELFKDSRLNNVHSVRLYAYGGNETTKIWNERAPLILKSLGHVKHFYVSHTMANAPENSPIKIEDPALFFSPFQSLKTMHLEFVQFPKGINCSLSHLKRFSWITPIPDREIVSELFKKLGKKLKILQLDFCGGGIHYDAEFSLKEMSPLLTGGFPNLKKLALVGTQSNKLADAVLKNPLVKKLNDLDLSSHRFTENMFNFIGKNSAHYQHLKTFVISECIEDDNQNEIDESVFESLKSKFPKGNLEILMDGSWQGFQVPY